MLSPVQEGHYITQALLCINTKQSAVKADSKVQQPRIKP